MKKSLLTGLLSVLMISPVFAEEVALDGDNIRQRAKEHCQKNADKYVWIEANGGACIPVNACEKDKYKSSYCESSAFGELHVQADEALALTKMFVERFKLDCTPALGTIKDALRGSDAFVKCLGSDYKAFKFASISQNYTFGYHRPDFYMGQCFAISAKFVRQGSDMGCVLLSKESCDKLGGTMVKFEANQVYTPTHVDSPADISTLPYASQLLKTEKYCKLPNYTPSEQQE